MVNAEDQLARVGRLSHVAIDDPFDRQRPAIVSREDRRANRRKRIEALRPRVLNVLCLQIAGGDVVDARHSQHVVERLLFRNAVRALADDDAELGLMIDTADAGWNPDWLAV